MLTAAPFTLGKFLIGLYLGRGAFTSTFGAAGSLVVILLWIYYSAQNLLLGAEFTHLYALRQGAPATVAAAAAKAGAALRPDGAGVSERRGWIGYLTGPERWVPDGAFGGSTRYGPTVTTAGVTPPLPSEAM